MKECLEESVGVRQREEVASRNDRCIHANPLMQEQPLKLDGKETVVSPDYCCSGDVGPPLDIARLTEGDVDLVPRIGSYRSSLLRCEVMEKIRLEVEIGVVSAGVRSGDPSCDRAGCRPPLPGRLSGRRHHCVDKDEPADWNPVTSHHGAEGAHRLSHNDWFSTSLDGIDDHCRVVG